MPRSHHPLAVSSPGRICLFGEHQDYLGLPVIAAAIDLRATITASPRRDRKMRISLIDLDEVVEFSIEGRQRYEIERDYFRSGWNVLYDAGLRFDRGWDCEVTSRIPVKAGTSSSSAMMVAWIGMLMTIAGQQVRSQPEQIANYAYRAEVLEFDEPGGMMDQFTSAYGGVIYLDFARDRLQRLPVKLGSFVLGDSQQPKDTKGVLSNIRFIAQEAANALKKMMPEFDLHETSVQEAQDHIKKLPPRHAEVLLANLIDRDILRTGKALLQQASLDRRRFGELLSWHHEQLSRRKRVSTPKIDAMLDAALKAGAAGGKINGSGGGGCMFAYAPDCAEAVAEAIKSAGGVPYVVNVDRGVDCEIQAGG